MKKIFNNIKKWYLIISGCAIPIIALGVALFTYFLFKNKTKKTDKIYEENIKILKKVIDEKISNFNYNNDINNNGTIK